jgi:three-Cys-motif partner protein
MLDRYEKSNIKFGPALAFLDQFGYGAVSMDLIKRIMSYPQCEVFTYLNYKDMNRWISDPAKAAAFTRAFGGEEWRKCIDPSREAAAGEASRAVQDGSS